MSQHNTQNIAFITGANNGIGLELTRRLLRDNWQVIALVRSAFPKEDNLVQISIRSGQLKIYQADIADFRSLKLALQQIKTNERKIDILFNNAGGSFDGERYTKQNRELHFDLQTVAPYIILMELKELLLRGSNRTVINTSTNSFKGRRSFDADTLERPTDFTKLFGPYSTSKLALSLWTRELAADLETAGIRILSVDPGGNNTLRKGQSSGIPFYLRPVIKLFFPAPTKGAALLYEAGTAASHMPSGSYVSGGKAAALKFTEQGGKVLKKVKAIYEQEFASLA
jgi:NAD(P)-dependent dehydrogenase (short-subunit alcohol dehydrogenase family)